MLLLVLLVLRYKPSTDNLDVVYAFVCRAVYSRARRQAVLLL